MSLMPDVTDLLHDPDVGAKPFSILRRTGQWSGGRMHVSTSQSISAVGVMLPPSSEQLSFFPEGERRNGQVAIYTETILHLTEGEEIADEVTWQGDRYKIIRVDRWDEYGFCIAYAQKR